MKIMITANGTTTRKTIDTIADVVNEFQPNTITPENRAHALNQIERSSRVHRFPAAEWQYTADHENNIRTFELAIEDDAVMMALPMAIKAAKIIAPFWDMGKAAVKLAKNLKDQFNGITSNFKAEFGKKFGRPVKYATQVIWNEELHVASIVVMEDNGFGERRIAMATHCWESIDMDALHRLFDAAEKRGIETKDSKTERYPEITWEEITEDEAIKRAEEMRHGVQADVDGMLRKMADDEKAKQEVGNQVNPETTTAEQCCDGKIAERKPHYALVVVGINATLTDYRKYAAVVDEDHNIVNDIITMQDMKSALHEVDMDNLAMVIKAKSRTGAFTYSFTSIEEIQDVITVMANDETFYSHKNHDKRINWLSANSSCVYTD